MKSLHVKRGDRVKVISGKDKGAIGEIIAVDVENNRVTVQGVNIVTRHLRDTQGADGKVVKGGKVSSEAPIHASNVQLVISGSGDKAVTGRVGYKRVEVTKRRPDGSEYSAMRSVRVVRKRNDKGEVEEVEI